MQYTYKIIDLLENAIYHSRLNKKELATIVDIHTLEVSEVSKYIIITHYKNAVRKICEKIYLKINTIINKIDKLTKEYDEDTQFVYHSVKHLLYIYYRKNIIWFENDISQVMDILDDCAEMIKTYPSNGEIMFNIIRMHHDGLNENRIAKAINKSVTYVRNKESAITIAFMYLLFGHSKKINLRKK